MQQAKAGEKIPFDYTAYDQASGLYVQAKIYDVTVPSAPVLVSTVPMVHVAGGAYCAVFTGQARKPYLVVKRVYLDSGFTTIDPDRAPGSDSIQCVQQAASSSEGCQISGQVVDC